MRSLRLFIPLTVTSSSYMRSLLAALKRKKTSTSYRSYSHSHSIRRPARRRIAMVQLPDLSQAAAAARSWWQAPQYQSQNQEQQQSQVPPAPRAQIRRPSAPVGPSPPQSQRPIAFISGPLEVDQAYFSTHYLPKIRTAIQQGHSFLVGVSRGTDTLTSNYLRNCRVHPSRITIYFNTWEETKLRGNFRKFEESGGAVVIVHGGYTERDEAMTRASHYDILRYRTEEELKTRYGAKYRKRISGTQKNEMRRQQGVGLPWPGTDHLGERKEVKEAEDDVKEKEATKDSEETMTTLSKDDGTDGFGSPPPYSEKL